MFAFWYASSSVVPTATPHGLLCFMIAATGASMKYLRIFNALSGSVMLVLPGCFPDWRSSGLDASHFPSYNIRTSPSTRFPLMGLYNAAVWPGLSPYLNPFISPPISHHTFSYRNTDSPNLISIVLGKWSPRIVLYIV